MFFRNAGLLFVHPLGLLVHFVVEEGGFDAGVAGEAPTGGGDLMDEMQFGWALRAEVVDVVLQLGLVFFRGFVLEEDGLGGESMFDGVEGDGLAAAV